MKFAIRVFVIFGSMNIYNCIKCFQCTSTQECRETTIAVECADPIFEIITPACGTETSSSGVRRYCVAQGSSKKFGCVSTGNSRTCVCQSDGCNSPGAMASVADMTLFKPTVTQSPDRVSRSRSITKPTTVTKSSKKPRFTTIPPYKPPLQCFDCSGCKTPTNLQVCPMSATQCLSIITGDLVRRTCARFQKQNGCTTKRNDIGSESEICYCDKDSCNSSSVIKPSICIAILLTVASTKLFC